MIDMNVAVLERAWVTDDFVLHVAPKYEVCRDCFTASRGFIFGARICRSSCGRMKTRSPRLQLLN